MFAYLVRNAESRAVYVGITAKSVEERWETHLRNAANKRRGALYGAIRAAGAAAFHVEHVASARTWKQLCDIETLLIAQHRTYRLEGGFNMTFGGDGAFGNIMSAAARERIGSFHRGKKRPPEVMAKVAAKLSGRPLSAEHRAKTLAGLKRHYEKNRVWNLGAPMSQEQREKLKEAWKLRRLKWPNGISADARKKLSARSKADWDDPEKAAMNARRIAILREHAPKKHSDAAKAKMSAAAKVRKTSDEGRASRRRAMGQMWENASDEQRAKHSAGLRRAQAERGDEAKAAKATKLKNAWADPEKKVARSKAIKDGWARRRAAQQASG
jgi:hypothetical protein